MYQGVLFQNEDASGSIVSNAIETDSSVYGSFQFNWANLTGSVDAVVQLYVSDDNANWIMKTGATFTLSGANGSESISLNGGILTEAYIRAEYTPNSVAGGTLTCYATIKGLS